MFVDFDIAEEVIRREASKNGITLPDNLVYTGTWQKFDTYKKNGGAYWLKRSYNSTYGWSIWGCVRDWRDSLEPIFIKTIGNIKPEDLKKTKKQELKIQNNHLMDLKTKEYEDYIKENNQKVVANNNYRNYTSSLNNHIPKDFIYLKNHCIEDTEELEKQKVGYNPKFNCLVVPQFDNQTEIFTGYQQIHSNGTKFYLKGSKQKDVNFTFNSNNDNQNYVFIAEGFATAGCIFLFLEKQYTVISAMTCYNLSYCVDYAKKKFPNKKTVILADNDDNEIGFRQASLTKADLIILTPRLKKDDTDCCDYAKSGDLKSFILSKLSEYENSISLSQEKLNNKNKEKK